jgi:putative ABC transport system permease protein
VRISVTTLGGDRPLHRHSAYSGAARVLRTAPDEPLPAVLLPPSVARHLQVPVERDGVVLRVATPLSTVAQQAVAAALYALDPVLMPSWDPGYRDRYAALSTAFLIGGAVLAVLAALIATALAAVDRRRDAQVLAAVGARPGMRRLMAMTQALVIAGVGTLIGAAAGFVAPTAYVLAENRLRASPGFVPMQVTAPWPTLAALLVLVPVVAAALAPLFGRARLPVERLP